LWVHFLFRHGYLQSGIRTGTPVPAGRPERIYGRTWFARQIARTKGAVNISEEMFAIWNPTLSAKKKCTPC